MAAVAAENAAIEGFRGLAALMVMAAHFAGFFVPGTQALKFATTGVDLFFVLSGFVFAPYVLGRPLPLLPHLVRRFFRLYPLYLTALLAYALAKGAWLYFPAHALMLHTLSTLDVALFYNPAFWSLPPEVEFYLLLPVIARFGGVRALAILLPLSIVGREWLFITASGSPDAPGWRELSAVHLPGVLCEFMLGALAHVLASRPREYGRRARLLAPGLIALALVAAIMAAGGDAQEAPAWLRGSIGLLAATGYALVVASLASAGATASAAWRRAFVAAGHLSYAVYLFHNLAPTLVRHAVPGIDGAALGVGAVVLTLTVAVAANRIIETPLREFGRHLSRRLATVLDARR